MPCLAPAALGLVELCKNWRKWRKSRDFVVFLFLDTFEYNKMSRNRRNDKIPWESHLFKGLCCFSCFLTFFAIKSSRNRKNDKIPWSRHFFQGILLFLMFLDIFFNKKCLETGETPKFLEQDIFFSRNIVVSHVYLTFSVIKSVQKQENPLKLMIFSRALVVFLFLDTFESRKCL